MLDFDQRFDDNAPFCPNCNDSDEGCDFCEPEYEDDYEDDGQPSEYEEWQDVYGGDETPGDFDSFEGNCDY